MPAAMPLKVAVLHYQPGGEPCDPVVTHICEALAELGHTAETIAVHDRVSDILSALQSSACDLVFNVCETFADDYRMEVNVAALMEMAQIRFTGSGTAGLLLAAARWAHPLPHWSVLESCGIQHIASF
jgi:D-alanine-D-alanine ligase